jgi:LmbE family N-acetylglucosaminyl deacetylase/ActR/RegA family two-component response regulator
VRIEVWDTGPGIPEHARESIFRDFSRGESAEGNSGMGLGLAIVDRVANLLGHPLELRSTVGRGSLFSVTVPRAAEKTVAEPIARRPGALGGLRVLCVDDEPMVLRSLREQFERALGGFDIEVAAGALEALEILDELRADGVPVPVVVSDHIMPGMKGDELLVRVHERLPDTRTILLTGQAGLDAVARAVNAAGLYRYIAKPWDRDDLTLTVREAVRGYLAEQQVREQQARLVEAHRAATRFVPFEFLSLLGRSELAEVRRGELDRAVEILKIARHDRLGFRDSGMMGWSDNNHPNAFWNQDPEVACAPLVEILRAERPQVIMTYNAFGFYGHPDHIQAHRITLAAVAQLDYEPTLYFNAIPTTVMNEMRARWRQEAIDRGEEPGEDGPDLSTPESDIAVTVDIAEYSGIKFDALAAHRSQIGENSGWMKMGRDGFRERMVTEWFVRATNPLNINEPATDLFVGYR